MLVASADVSAALLVERDRHVAAGNELAQDIDEDAIAERLCEVEVKGAGELHGRERVAARIGLRLARHLAPQSREPRARDARGAFGEHVAFDQPPHLV